MIICVHWPGLCPESTVLTFNVISWCLEAQSAVVRFAGEKGFGKDDSPFINDEEKLLSIGQNIVSGDGKGNLNCTDTNWAQN